MSNLAAILAFPLPLPRKPLPDVVAVAEAHKLYCAMTGQDLILRYDRERQWYELLKEYEIKDVRQVILYLQREIREKRRNVGALKLTNFLQLDRFEEDLNISRVKLKPVLTAQRVNGMAIKEIGQVSQKALEILRECKKNL